MFFLVLISEDKLEDDVQFLRLNFLPEALVVKVNLLLRLDPTPFSSQVFIST